MSAMFRLRYASLLLLVLAQLAACAAAGATEATKQLAPGVMLHQEINTDPACALVITSVTIDPFAPGVSIKPALGQDTVIAAGATKGREAISALTSRKKALLGVNGDFFPFTGDPLGICVIDGEMVSEPTMNRASIGWSKSGGIIFNNPRLDAALILSTGVRRQIDGINRGRESNQVIVYTPAFGVSTGSAYPGTEVVATSSDLPVRIGKSLNLTVTDVFSNAVNTAIPRNGMVISAGGPAAVFLKENLKPGDTLCLKFDVRGASSHDWSSVEQAIGGGPWLVKDGAVCIDAAEEGFRSGFSSAMDPRTAIGATCDGKIVIATVDGRQSISRGVNLADLAAIMKRLGALNAINLDGGGSTTMSIAGMVVNSPSGGVERPVANGILVFADQGAPGDASGLSIAGVSGEAAIGCGAQLSLVSSDGAALRDEQAANVIWGTTGGIGFVNQKGYFTPVFERTGKVSALYGGQIISQDVKVVSGGAVKVVVELVPDPNDALRAAVRVKVFDINLNKLTRKQVVIEVTGGGPDVTNGFTDGNGEFTTVVTWDVGSPVRCVAATAEGVTGTASLDPH